MWVAVGVGVIGAVTSYSSASSSRQAQEANMTAQYNYDMENYRIQQGYHTEMTGYGSQLNAYADQQQAFAYEQLAFANKEYQTALRNNQALQNFKEQEVYNQKLAGKAELNATTDVANLLQLGAENTMNDVIGESLRTGSANTRDVDRLTKKAQSQVVAAKAGVTGGKSADRQQVEVLMERNREVAKLKDKTKTQLITASQQKDKVVNDTTLRVGEAYRSLQALLRLEASPMQELAGPSPVFLGRAPVAPISPMGAEPIMGASVSGGTAADLAAGLGGLASGLQLGNAITSF